MLNRGVATVGLPRRQELPPDVFKQIWHKLEVNYRIILRNEASNGHPGLFEQIYRDVYKLVLKKRGEQLYSRFMAFLGEYLRKESFPKFATAIRNELKFLETTNSRPATTTETSLVDVIAMSKNFQIHVHMIMETMQYLERMILWEDDTSSFFDMQLCFQNQVLHQPLDENGSGTVLSSIIKVILHHVHMERQGQEIDRQLIKDCTYMLEGLPDINRDPSSDERKDNFYLKYLEPDFLAASRVFYNQEAKATSAQEVTAEHVLRVRRRRQEELDRCQDSLSPLSEWEIAKLVDEALVVPYLGHVASGEQNVLIDAIVEDRRKILGAFYDLSCHVDPQKRILANVVNKALHTLRSRINESLSRCFSSDEDTSFSTDWLRQTLGLKLRFQSIWRHCFRQDTALLTVIERSFQEFLNSDPRSPVLLAKSVSELIRRPNESTFEVDFMDEAIAMLQDLDLPELFEREYYQQLSAALDLGQVTDIDREVRALSKMKLRLGTGTMRRAEMILVKD